MAYENNTIIEARVHYVANLQQCMNVVHYFPTNNGVGPVRDLVRGFLNAFKSVAVGTLIYGMKQLTSTDVVFNRVTAQAIFPTRWILEEVEDFSDTGDIDERCNAQNVQMCFTKKGDLGNRHNVGSFHLGGLPDAIFKLGGWDEPTIDPRIGAMLTGLEWRPNDVANGIEYAPTILNKTKVIVDGKPKYVVSGQTFQTAVIFKPELRVMPRRTVGRGI